LELSDESLFLSAFPFLLKKKKKKEKKKKAFLLKISLPRVVLVLALALLGG